MQSLGTDELLEQEQQVGVGKFPNPMTHALCPVAPSPPSAFIDGSIGHVVIAGIDLGGSEDPVFCQLFIPVR